MELIIVILFFSIASVVCVQLFVNAYMTNQSTKENSRATIITQNLAEGFIGCGGDTELMASVFDRAVLKDSILYLYYDSEWTSLSGETGAYYIASIAPSDSGEGITPGSVTGADITIENTSGEEILTQHVSHYEQYRLEDVK